MLSYGCENQGSRDGLMNTPGQVDAFHKPLRLEEGPEALRMHHHPKSEVPVSSARAARVAVGTPHNPPGAEKCAASQHAGLIIKRLQGFTPCPLFGITGVRVVAPQTPGPLPDVPNRIQQSIGAGTSGV